MSVSRFVCASPGGSEGFEIERSSIPAPQVDPSAMVSQIAVTVHSIVVCLGHPKIFDFSN
jgi:hypothetical protein